MKHLYCISGMGCDERMFSHLELDGFDIHFIKWIVPEKRESISAYAQRLLAQVHHANPVMLGISLGGMMCIEISKLIPVEKILIISSIKSREELPTWMKMAGKLKLDRVIPLRSTKLTEPLQNYNLGLETEEEKKLVMEYRETINQRYLDWAVHNVLNWKNKGCAVPLYHIHGSKDRLFPIKKVKPDWVIPSAGHFLVMNRASLLNNKINEIFESF